jgi:hypothetical protein
LEPVSGQDELAIFALFVFSIWENRKSTNNPGMRIIGNYKEIGENVNICVTQPHPQPFLKTFTSAQVHNSMTQ